MLPLRNLSGFFAAALLCCATALPVSAQSYYNAALPPQAQAIAGTLADTYRAPLSYVESFLHQAMTLERTQGIPAAATVGIAVLESGGFSSELFQQANNPFGIKASSPWTGPTYEMQHDYELTPFRVYSGAEAAVADFGRLIAMRPWFADARSCPAGDAQCFLDSLVPTLNEPGYSRDPYWADKVRGIIARYDLEALGTAEY